MTDYEYFPFLFMKRYFCSECGIGADFLLLLREGIASLERILELQSKLSIKAGFAGRFNSTQVAMDSIKDHYKLPWYLKCNPDRFPTWYSKIDPRILASKAKFDFVC
jgi:hypothetical protein